MPGHYTTRGHVTVGLFVPTLCSFLLPSPSPRCSFINRAARQVKVRGAGRVSAQVQVFVCGEGESAPAVAEVAHGSVGRDNCR